MVKIATFYNGCLYVVFDAATVAVLGAVFDDAWKLLQDSSVTFASDGQAEQARVTIGKYIIEAAKLGERDRLRLRDDALTHYAKSIVKPPQADRK